MEETSDKRRAVGPVRVLHLIDGLGGGGSERWLWDIVRLCPSEKVKHFVITIFPDKGDFVYADLLREKGEYGQKKGRFISSLREKGSQALTKSVGRSRVRVLGEKVWRAGCYLSASWLVMKALVRFRPDIVHVHTFLGFSGGLILKLICRMPFVHTVPCLFLQMTDAGFDWMPKKYFRYHQIVDEFFTGASRNDLESIGVPSKKIKMIRGVVDLKSIAVARGEQFSHSENIQKSLKLTSNTLIGLSVGRLHSSKGHHFVLEALPILLSQFPTFHWVVLGEGLQRGQLEARAKELGVESHVHLVGFQSAPFPYYAAANIYLRTAVFEAENLSSYQAMAFGLPVVGFDTGCETELVSIVKHGILVPNRDPLALAGAIEQVLLLPDKGQKMGAKGEAYCRENLDIRQTIEDFCSTYEHLRSKATY